MSRGGSLSRGGLCTVKSGWYASYWNAFLLTKKVLFLSNACAHRFLDCLSASNKDEGVVVLPPLNLLGMCWLCLYLFYSISFSLQTTKKPAGHFVIHPDWCSEKIDTPRFEGRPYRPWSYEFHGARTYPPPGNKANSTLGARRAQSAPASRSTMSVNNVPGVHHSLKEPRSQTRAASAAHALQETRDWPVMYPKTMMYLYEDGACHIKKHRVSQPLDGMKISSTTPDVGCGIPCPPPGGYRISHAPDGSIRRLRMTPTATSLYLNTSDMSTYQQMSQPDTSWTIPQCLETRDGVHLERDYNTDPDLAELYDYLHYLPDGKYYHSNQCCSHGNSTRNQMAPVNYRYPAAPYRQSSRVAQPAMVGDMHLRNAKYGDTPLKNPYMNFVNSKWMV